MSQGDLNHGNVTSRAPSLSDQGLTANIVVQEIQGLINRLFFLNNIRPARQALSNGDQFHPPIIASIVEDNLKILKSADNLLQGVRTLVGISINGIDRGSHRFSNFSDLGKECVSMSENDENVLPRLNSGNRVDERLLNVRVVHVQVSTKDSPEDTLERRKTRTLNSSGDKPETGR